MPSIIGVAFFNCYLVRIDGEIVQSLNSRNNFHLQEAEMIPYDVELAFRSTLLALRCSDAPRSVFLLLYQCMSVSLLFIIVCLEWMFMYSLMFSARSTCYLSYCSEIFAQRLDDVNSYSVLSEKLSNAEVGIMAIVTHNRASLPAIGLFRDFDYYFHSHFTVECRRSLSRNFCHSYEFCSH